MNSSQIEARIDKLAVLFDHYQLKSSRTPFVDITTISPVNNFTRISYGTFFSKPSHKIISLLQGPEIVQRVDEVKTRLTMRIPFLNESHSISDGFIKSKVIKTTYRDYIIISVGSDSFEDQDTLIKELEVILKA